MLVGNNKAIPLLSDTLTDSESVHDLLFLSRWNLPGSRSMLGELCGLAEPVGVSGVLPARYEHATCMLLKCVAGAAVDDAGVKL